MTQKPILVVTHERSGTHLMINLINYHKKGEFYTIGYIPKLKGKVYTLDEYQYQTYRDIIMYSFSSGVVCKSHHQVEFMENYLDFVFDKYKVIYVKRDVRDMLVSYYRFLFDKKPPIPFEEWIWMKPSDVGNKYLLTLENHLKGTDPHVMIEPENYVDRWKMHVDGWEKYKDQLLVVTYEDILQNFSETKRIVEDHTGRTIKDSIPDLHDKDLPNFAPNKGVVGGHKDIMDNKLIENINRHIYNK